MMASPNPCPTTRISPHKPKLLQSLRHDLAYTFKGIKDKTPALLESRWLILCSFFKYFVVISVLTSYMVPTYLATFDIRFYDYKTTTGMILHAADLCYVMDIGWRILFEDLHLFRYNFEPEGGSCYQFSMALNQYRHYFKSIVFLAQLFPLEYLAFFWKNINSIEWLRIYAYMRLYRVYRLEYIYHWFISEKERSCVTLPGRLWRTASILLLTFIVIVYHFVACFWYRLNCDPVINNISPPYCPSRWLQRYYDYTNEDGVIGSHPFYSPVKLDQPDPLRRYMGSLIWSVMTIRNTANFYTAPIENWEMFYCIMFMAFSFIAQFFFILVLLNLTLLTDMPRLLFFAEVQSVRSFMRRLGFDYMTQASVLDCLSSVWNRRRVYSDQGIRHLIPPVLEQSIYVERAAPLIYASELLQTLTRAAIEALAPSVQFKRHYVGDFLIRPDTMDRNMIFITYGKVQIVDPVNNKRVMNLAAGSLIGEANLLIPSYRSVGLQAMTDCETMVLSWKALNDVLKVDTAARRQMHIIILRRIDFVCPRFTPEQESSERKREREEKSNKHKVSEDMSVMDSIISFQSMKSSMASITSSIVNAGEISLMSQFVSLFSYRRHLKLIRFNENQFNEYDRNVAWKLQPTLRNRASNSSYKFAKQVWMPAFNFSFLYGWAISKDTLFCQLWNCFMFVYVIWYTIWFMVAFLSNTTGTEVTIINAMTDILYTLDVVFLLAVFRNPSHMTSKIDVQEFTTQLHVELRTYRAWFDILAVFPFWYLSSTVPAPLTMRLNRLLKFFCLFYKTRNLEHNIKLNLLISRMVKHCMNIFGFVILVGFISTAFHCVDTGYRNCVIEKSTLSAVRYNYNDPTESIFGIFLYWALSVIFGIGFRDLHGISDNSWVYILPYLLGFYLLIACWAELIATCVEMSDIQMRYKLARDWLFYGLKKSYAGPQLITSVDNFLVNQWKSWRGIESLEQDRTFKFVMVGHKVYEEMVVEATVETVCSIKLFKWMDPSAMREFCAQTRLINVGPNTVIIPYMNYVKRMYIVRRGVVEVKVISGIGNPVVHKYGRGQCLGFGEMALKLPSMVQIKSCTDVQLILIESSVFDGILSRTKVYGNAWKNLINVENQENYRRILSPSGWENVLRYQDSSMRQPPAFIPALHFYSGPTFEERKLKLSSNKWVRPWKESPWWIRIFRHLTLGVTIHPMKSFEKTWETLRLGVIYVTLFIVPIAEAFPCAKQTLLFAFIIYFSDIVSLMDMFFRFYTAYFDPKYRFHPAQTIKNYLTTAFITDVFGGPIFYYTFQVYLQNWASVKFGDSIFVYICKLNRIIMIYHIYGYNKQVNKKLRDPSYFKKLLQIIPILMFHSHLISCILAVMACPSLNCPYSLPRCKNKTWITNSLLHEDYKYEPRWAGDPNFPRDTEIYTAAFYYTTTTAAGCAFGDFVAVNSSERIVMALTLFFYVIGTAYIMARVVAIKPMVDFRLRGFQKQINHLMDFLVEGNVDYHLKTTILGYYEHQWHKSGADNPREHLMTLFPSLREDVAMHFYRLVFHKDPALQRASSGFLRSLCEIIQLYYIPMNQVIFREGDVAEIFYIIKSGIVLCSKEAYLGTRIKDYGTLGTFGDFYDYTCVAMDQLQLLAYSHQDLAQLAVVFPDDVRYIREILRLDRAQAYNKDGKGKQLNDTDKSIPLKRTMSDLTPLSEKHREYLDVCSTHNIQFVGYKKRLDPAFDDPLSLGIQPLADLENDFDMNKFDYQVVYRGFVINHDSTLVHFLNLLYFIGALGSTFAVSYQAAFKNFEIYMFCISYAFDAIYVAKMIVSFFVASVDDDGTIVGDWGDIIAKYFGHLRGFTFDLITIFPFEVIAPSQIEWLDTWHLATMLRLNRLLRVVHVWNYFNPKDYHAGYNVHLNRLKIARVIVFTCVYLHLMACLLFFWTLIGCKNPKVFNLTACMNEFKNTTWLGTKTDFEDSGDFLKYPYIYAMYFVCTTFSAISYGDVRPITEFEMIFTSVLAITSKAWLALTLADLVNCLHVYLEPKATYRLAVSESLAEYKYDGVSDDILQRVSDHFEALWVYNRGLFEPKFVIALPLGLKTDLKFHLHEKHFMKSYLFYNLPDNFCRAVSVKFQRMMVLQGEYIVKSGQIGDSMYFINFGTVYYRKTYPELDKDGHYKTKEGRVNFPRHFGEENAILGTRRHNCSYVAETDVELVFLSHSTLKQLFHSCFADVMQIVMKRFEKAQHLRRGISMSKNPQDLDEYDSSDESETEDIPQTTLMRPILEETSR